MKKKKMQRIPAKKRPTQKPLKSNASKLHAKVYNFCKERFPLFNVYQEYPIECSDRGSKRYLFFDIYIQELNMAIECQGIQHYKPNAFFFGGSFEFKQAQKLDKMKVDWCKKNEMILVYFKYNDKLTKDFLNKTIEDAIRRNYE